MENRKPKIQEFIFIRAICAIWIIIYHFSCYSHSAISSLHYNANSQWGSPVVAVFFILSGAVLRYNNEKIKSLGLFYYKRWKSIFPAFYIAFAFLFLQNVFEYGDLFYLGEPWKLIFTVLGIDGYVNIPNYYIIGEWFLGAIVILYLLFPAINWLRNKNRIVATATVLILYIICIFTDFMPMYKFREIPICLAEMYFGMVCIDYMDKMMKSRASLIISCAIAVILIFVKIPWPNVLYMCELPATLLGMALFIILYRLGTVAMNNKTLKPFFSELGMLSYPIFLLQHVIIQKMVNYQNPYSLSGGIIVLLITIMLTVIFAKVLDIVTKAVINSKVFLRLEKSIIK